MKLIEFKEKVIELRGEKEWEKVENSDTYKIYKSSEEEQLEAIRNDRSDTSNIYNPSEELQLEAIKKDPWNIMFMKNPTDKVILEVLKSNMHIRTLIKDILRHIEDDINK